MLISRLLFLIMLIVTMGFIAAVRYPIEKLVVADPTSIQDGSCWCCSCGWQSCKTCAANAKKCCPQPMSFQRWNFGKGGEAMLGENTLDLVSNTSDGALADAEKVIGGSASDNAEIKPGSYEQRQALLNALEKAGIQPQTLTAEQIALMLQENDLGASCS